MPEIVVTAPAIRDETPAPADLTAFASVIETREAATTVETLADGARRHGRRPGPALRRPRRFQHGVDPRVLAGPGAGLSRRRSAQPRRQRDRQPERPAARRRRPRRGVPRDDAARVRPVGTGRGRERRHATAGGRAAGGGERLYGSFDTRKGTIAVGNSHGAWDGLLFAQYLGSQGDFDFTNRTPAAQNPQESQDTRINNAFDQGNLTARLVYRGTPLTVAVTADSFAKSQGLPGRGEVQSKTAHQDTFRQVADVTVGLAPSGPFSIGAEAKLYGLHQEQTFESHDLKYGASDNDDTSTTVGGQLVLRGSVGAHHVPGLLLASGVERFVLARRDRRPDAASGDVAAADAGAPHARR